MATTSPALSLPMPSGTASTKSLLRRLGILPYPVPEDGGVSSSSSSASGAASMMHPIVDLELQHKHITASEAVKLCGPLRTNATITCLKVGCNELRDEVRRKVGRGVALFVGWV